MFARAQDSILYLDIHKHGLMILELKTPTVAGNKSAADILRFVHGKGCIYLKNNILKL